MRLPVATHETGTPGFAVGVSVTIQSCLLSSSGRDYVPTREEIVGTLVASFRFNVRGMSLTESIDCATDQHRITLSVVDPNGPELSLTITLDDTNETIALARAQAIADAVYERMLLDLSPHVAGSARPI